MNENVRKYREVKVKRSKILNIKQMRKEMKKDLKVTEMKGKEQHIYYIIKIQKEHQWDRNNKKFKTTFLD